MPEPTPDSTQSPVQENIRFAVCYGNVYVDLATGDLELGARIYRTPGAADERRRTHPCREGLGFVGVFPVSAVVPDSLRDSARRAAIREAREESQIETVTPVGASMTPAQEEQLANEAVSQPDPFDADNGNG